MNKITYKILGARASLPASKAGIKELLSQSELSAVKQKGPNFGQLFSLKSFLDEIAKHKIVFLGEVHGAHQVVSLQTEIQKRLIQNLDMKIKLNVIMEHFSFEMQHLLDNFQEGKLEMEQMISEYQAIGTEGHDIIKYRELLEHARENKDQIKLIGGFIPRTYAKLVMREGEEAQIKSSIEKDYIQGDTKSFEGTDFHYNMFESMISGRDMYDPNLKPNDNYKKIFKAQLIKDYAMAHCINKLLKQDSQEQKYLVIAGKGHVMHYCGVPERVFSENPQIKEHSCLVVTDESNESLDAALDDEKKLVQGLLDTFGEEGTNPADFIYVFDEDEEVEEKVFDHGELVKQETAAAYNKVGETAHLKGNLKKATAIMKYLGYTDREIEIAGQDAYNYQGVGNPHLFAKIQPGEKVLDLGSGLGVDSFIACEYSGPTGKVVGLDISKTEIRHAENRALERGLNMKFICADMENIPLPDDMIDVVISNGAFCLAPSKEKAFREIFRVLRPGGRMSICTSTVKMDLQPGVNWPICMRMFVHISQLEPICKDIGFQNIIIDQSNDLMQYDLPGDENEEKQPSGENGQIVEQKNENLPDRNRVHVGSEEFKHLKEFDMNKICSRVTVIATKPIS